MIENNYFGHHELLYNLFFYLKKNKYNIEYFNNYIKVYSDYRYHGLLIRKIFLNKNVDIILHPCKNEKDYLLLESFNLIFDKKKFLKNNISIL